jgi:hypothetical protein
MYNSKFALLGNFLIFNDDYFDGVLPTPQLKSSHSYRTLGYFHCDVDDFGNPYNEIIEISNYYDYTFEQFRDVLVHEMIHYYLLYMGIDTKCSHGKHFKRMCRELNEKYGLNLSTKIDISDYKINEGRSKLWFNICTFF